MKARITPCALKMSSASSDKMADLDDVARNFGIDLKNTTEAIANKLDHLFGFMGVVPRVGMLGNMVEEYEAVVDSAND